MHDHTGEETCIDQYGNGMAPFLAVAHGVFTLYPDMLPEAPFQENDAHASVLDLARVRDLSEGHNADIKLAVIHALQDGLIECKLGGEVLTTEQATYFISEDLHRDELQMYTIDPFAVFLEDIDVA